MISFFVACDFLCAPTYSLVTLQLLFFAQETLIASVRAETLNIDASDLNGGKAFSRVASKYVHSWASAVLSLLKLSRYVHLSVLLLCLSA